MLDVLGNTAKTIGESTIVNKVAAKQVVGQVLPSVKDNLRGLAGKVKKVVPKRLPKKTASRVNEGKGKKGAEVMQVVDIDSSSSSSSSDEDEYLSEEEERVNYY